MSRREQLRENYEDALFALLMDYVAEAEGKEALEENERLRRDPEAAVPAEVDKACRRAIDRAFGVQTARTAGRIAVRVFRVAATVALLGTLIVSAAFAASPKFRAGTLNLIMDTFNDGMSFDMKHDTTGVNEFTELEDIVPAWIPDGYELVEEGSFAGDFWLKYCTEQGDQFNITLTSSIDVDTADAKIEWIEVGGLPGCLVDQIDSWGIIQLIITNEAQGYIINLTSIPNSTNTPIPIDREDIVLLAESIFE